MALKNRSPKRAILLQQTPRLGAASPALGCPSAFPPQPFGVLEFILPLGPPSHPLRCPWVPLGRLWLPRVDRGAAGARAALGLAAGEDTVEVRVGRGARVGTASAAASAAAAVEFEALAEEHNALAIEAFGLEQYGMAAEARGPNPNPSSNP